MNDINIFVSGEIYLKKGPEPFNASQMLSTIYDKIDDCNFELSKEDSDLSYAWELDACEKIKDKFEAVDGEMDYSYCDNFWQAFINNGKIVLRCCYERNVSRVFNSVQELEMNFVKLSDFLNNATFVGRKFKRTKPIVSTSGGDDLSFMSVDDNYYYIVLYAMQDLFLVEFCSSLFHKNEYRLINSRYTLDGNYEFYGQEHLSYADKDLVYQEILEQLEDQRKDSSRAL